MFNTNDLVLCVNDAGIKFGTIRETEFAIWRNEVKEFVDLEGRVYIVSVNHINKPMENGVDNIYNLSELMSLVWDEKDSTSMGNFTTTELHILMDVYNLGEVEEDLLKNVDEHFSRMYESNHIGLNQATYGEEE